MKIQELPKEILEQISEHVTIQDFYRLFMSSHKLKLPKIPYLTFDSYRESNIVYDTPTESIMKLHMCYLDLERFFYLVQVNHCAEFHRCLVSAESSGLAPQFKQEAFRIAMIPVFKPDIVLELVRDGQVDPSCYNNTALRMACKEGFVDLAYLLLQDPRVDPTQHSNSALRLAIINGHLDILKLVLEHGACTSTSNNQEPICFATRRGHFDIVLFLLEDPDVDPTARNHQPLKNACELGFVDITRLLLNDDRVDPCFGDQAAVQIAAKFGQVDIVRLLLQDPRLDPHHNNDQVMLVAVESNQLQVVQLLVQEFNLDPLFNQGESIQVAAQMGFIDLLTYFLRLAWVREYIQLKGVPQHWIPSVPEQQGETGNETPMQECIRELTKLQLQNQELPTLI